MTPSTTIALHFIGASSFSYIIIHHHASSYIIDHYCIAALSLKPLYLGSTRLRMIETTTTTTTMAATKNPGMMMLLLLALALLSSLPDVLMYW
jgi:hypothetical protein